MDETILREAIDTAIEDILENEPSKDASDLSVDEILEVVKDDDEIELDSWSEDELADIVSEELTNF